MNTTHSWEAFLRTFLAILVFFGNAVAPWLCCCTLAKAVSHGPTVPNDRSKPVTSCCSHCFQESEPAKPVDTRHDRPCPLHQELLARLPTLNVERSHIVQIELFCDFETTIYDFPSNDRSIAHLILPEVGSVPTLLMSVLRLKHHHCLLC
jgi:hypothetical protein